MPVHILEEQIAKIPLPNIQSLTSFFNKTFMSTSSKCFSFNRSRVSLKNLMCSIFLIGVTIKYYINPIHMGKAKPVWS
jgi:hypothetical protein